MGRTVFLEAQVRRVGGVQRHQNGIVLVVLTEHRQMNLRVMVARKAHEAAFAGLLGRFESFNGSAGRKDLLHLVHRGDLVNLPKVQVIRLQCAQGFFEVGLGSLARTLRGFRGEKNIFSEWRQHVSVDLFRFPIPVNPGAVKVVDAEFVGAKGNGLGVFVTAHRESPAGLADDRQPLSCLPKHSLGDVTRLQRALIRSARIHRESGRSGCCKEISTPHKESPSPGFAFPGALVPEFRLFDLRHSARGGIITRHTRRRPHFDRGDPSALLPPRGDGFTLNLQDGSLDRVADAELVESLAERGQCVLCVGPDVSKCRGHAAQNHDLLVLRP